MEKKKIMLVDDNAVILDACKKTLKDDYDVFPVQSTEKMFELLSNVIPDLILLDVEMPVTNGYEAMRILKANDAYKDIPVIFLSAMDDTESEIEGLDLGAVDYIHKPFVGALLAKRIATHISLIAGKAELQKLNRSINELLGPGGVEHNEEDAIMELMTKEDILIKRGREIRTPLNTIIEMIETALMENDVEEIKRYLKIADIETRLISEIIDDIFDMA